MEVHILLMNLQMEQATKKKINEIEFIIRFGSQDKTR